MKFLKLFISNASMPTTTKRIVSTNAFWLSLERVFRLSINFIVAVYLARFLGPDKYGVLSYVLSLTAFFFIFSDLGLDSIITRELVKRGISNKILGTAFIIKFIGSIFSTIVLLGLILIFQKHTYLKLFLIASPLLFLKSFSVIENYFQSKNLNKIPSVAGIIGIAFFCALNLFFIFLKLDLVFFILVYPLELFLYYIIIFFLFQKEKIKIHFFYFNSRIAKSLLSESWPIIIIGASSIISMRIDQVFIGNMLNSSILGNYSVSAKISEAFLFLPAVVGKSIYPSLIELNKKNKLKYKRVVKAILGFSIVFSFVLGLFISLFSNEIINLLFGEKYYLAASYLNTYIWSIVPSLAFFVFAQIFYIEKLIKNTFIISISSIVLNTILNYIWITKIGVFGALYASIVTSLITNFLFIYIIYKKSTIFKSND